MSVYCLGPSAPGFVDLAPVNSTVLDALSESFDGTPMLKRWRPLEVEAFTEEPELGNELGDYARLSTVPAFSEKATRVLGSLLSSHGELLPLRMSPPFFAFNALTVIPALDEPRSAITRFSSGKVMMVSRFVFDPDLVRSAVVFKVPQLRRSKVFVTDQFVEKVKQAGLRGFGYDLVWRGGERP